MDRQQLRNKENHIWDKMLNWVTASHKLQLAIKVGPIILGSLAAAIGGSMDGDLHDKALTLKGLLVIVGTFSSAMGGMVLLLADREIPDLVNNIRNDLSDFSSFLDIYDNMLTKEQWRVDCEAASMVMMNAVENTLINSDIPVEDNIQSVLEVCHPSLLSAFNIYEDDWTISVFRHDEKSFAMIRVAQCWCDDGSSDRDKRQWVKNQGFTGQAWADRRILAESDAQSERARQRYSRPPEKSFGVGNSQGVRPDDDKFRSVACVPIRLGVTEGPWGMLTVTSDVVGRFDYPSTGTRGSENIPLLKLTAAFFALVAAGST
jgi:hypothetical protein